MFAGILLELDPSQHSAWTPHTVEGEAFIHHILGQWYAAWGVEFSLAQVNTLYQQLTVIKQSQQAQVAVRQVCTCTYSHYLYVVV